jgi:diacylglycerol kinase
MWIRKFGNAARGIKVAVRGESSFFVHLFATTVVVLAAIALDISLTSWCLLTICIANVLVAEMFNTAIERLARVFTEERNSQIRDVLDVCAGGVLLTSIGAGIVGAILLGRPLLVWLVG